MADEVEFEDKDKTAQSTDPRKQFRDQDANELKNVINTNAAELEATTAAVAAVDSTLDTVLASAPTEYNTFLEVATKLTNLDSLKAPINNPTFTGTVAGVTKTMVGLDQVDNTTDLEKPISNLTQTALNTKAARTDFAKGIAVVGTLDGVNTVFTIAQTIVSGSEDVFVNGQRKSDGVGYNMTYPAGVATITFTVAPESDADIKVNYIRP